MTSSWIFITTIMTSILQLSIRQCRTLICIKRKLVCVCIKFIHLQNQKSLQDFTVLPTKIFRRCVITSSSVIYLLTSSPTSYVRRLSLRRWFPIPSLYRSEKQKNHLPMVIQTEFARQKKSFPLEMYRRILFRRWYRDLPTTRYCW